MTYIMKSKSGEDRGGKEISGMMQCSISYNCLSQESFFTNKKKKEEIAMVALILHNGREI